MSRKETATFEATYPRHPFAPLVYLALVLGQWIRKWQSRAPERTQGGEVGEAA